MKTGDRVEVRNDETDPWVTRGFLYNIGEITYCTMRYQDLSSNDSQAIESIPWKYSQPLPEKKYRPYTMGEFCDAWVGFGRCEINGYKVYVVGNIGIELNDESIICYEDLINSKWPDGSLIGVEVVVKNKDYIL